MRIYRPTVGKSLYVASARHGDTPVTGAGPTPEGKEPGLIFLGVQPVPSSDGGHCVRTDQYGTASLTLLAKKGQKATRLRKPWAGTA